MANNLRKLKRAFAVQKQQQEAAAFKRRIAEAEEMERQRLARIEYQKLHPVSSGIIPMETYNEPKWGYKIV